MMDRRTLLKFLGLLPLIGPAIAKAAAISACQPRRIYAPYLPSGFPKWDKAVDGLRNAAEWATEIERSRLSGDITFPRVGEIWETVRDCEVSFRASIPFRPQTGTRTRTNMTLASATEMKMYMQLGFGLAKFHQDEKVRIIEIDGPKPIQVTFLPLRYQELHDQLVPEPTRKLPRYAGYVLHLRTARTIPHFSKEPSQTYFTEAFRLVGDKP
jgi:hypothetical protein